MFLSLLLFLIVDSSLDDIKYVLNPTFTEEHIENLDKSTKLSRAIDGSMYMPGIVGLNNIKANDYCNVVLQVQGKVYNVFFILCLNLLGIVSCKTFEKLFSS